MDRIRRTVALLAAIALLAVPVSAETTASGQATAAATDSSEPTGTTASTGTAPTTDATTVGTTAGDAPDGTTTAEGTTGTTAPAVVTEPRVDSICFSDGTAKQAVWRAGGVSRPVSETATVAGRKGGKALVFNGSGYIEVDIREMQAPFTLSLWANWQADPLSDAAQGQRLFTILKSDTENAIFCSPLTKRPAEELNGILLSSVCFFQKEWHRSLDFYPVTGAVSNALPLGGWHHVALTVSEQTVALYIDGVLWKEQKCDFTFADLDADKLLIGADNNGACGFTGWMEDARWYAGLLTATQIARLAQDADPFDPTVSVTPQVYTPAASTAAPLTEKRYTASTVDGKTVMTADTKEAAFWELPQLTAGQSVFGTLYLENRSKSLVTLRLEDIRIPQEAQAYLSELQMTVMDGEKLLYSGAYADIAGAALPLGCENAAYGRSVAYTVTISRPFSAKAPVVPASISWEFSCALTPVLSEQPGESKAIWLICLLLLSAALAVASVYWAVVRRPRRWFTVWDAAAVSGKKAWVAFRQKLPKRSKPDKTDAETDKTDTEQK